MTSRAPGLPTPTQVCQVRRRSRRPAWIQRGLLPTARFSIGRRQACTRPARGDRELCRRCAAAAAIREKALLLGQPDNPVGQRSPAQGALDGGSQRGAMQSVAAPVLRTASGRGQTWQGRRHRGNAQAADRRLERGDSSQTLRAALGRVPAPLGVLANKA